MSKEILFITPYNLFPPFWGGGTRTYHMIKHLSEEHKIHLISPSYKQFKGNDGSKYKKKLEKMGVDMSLIGPETSWIQYINPLILLKALHKALTKDIDLILCDYPWSGTYTLILHKLLGIPYFLLEHNVEYKIARQTRYEDPELTKKLERKVCESSEKIFCVSEKDEKTLIEDLNINEDKVKILKNGFDAKKFYPGNGNGRKIREELGVENDPLIFFCGKLDYLPNSEAAGLIYYEIMPRVLEEIPDAKFLIVGGGYELDFSHESLIMTGEVNNLVDYLKASDIVITPIRRGGGTRIKVLEAIACGKDIISTKKGVEGLMNKYTEPFVQISDNWDDFSRKIVHKIKNYEDPIPRDSYFEEYSWMNIFKTLEQFIEKL